MTTRAEEETNKRENVRAIPGTHELVVETALRNVAPNSTALDLGAWSGALAQRLKAAGLQVTAADIENRLDCKIPFYQLDFNDPSFDRVFPAPFDLVVSVEVIEHLENPTGFLRSVARLLKPGGVAIITTPNVDNVAARMKFLLNGKVRAMDEMAPEHITPIHVDLLVRQILPRTGLELIETRVHPEGDFPLTERRYLVFFLRMLVPFVKGPAPTGDTLIVVLRKIARTPPGSNSSAP